MKKSAGKTTEEIIAAAAAEVGVELPGGGGEKIKVQLPTDSRPVSDFAGELADVMRRAGACFLADGDLVFASRVDGFLCGITPDAFRTHIEKFAITVKMKMTKNKDGEEVRVGVPCTMNKDQATAALSCDSLCARLEDVGYVFPETGFEFGRKIERMDFLEEGYHRPSASFCAIEVEKEK